MTRRSLWRAAGWVVAIYVAAVATGVYLRFRDPSPTNLPYATFKDLVSLVIAIPAAWLAVSFQRRASYMQSLRALWRTTLDAVHSAQGYTYLERPTPEAYSRVLTQLSIAVDEVRGVFRNLPVRGKPRGWYPFEPLKQVREVVRDLGYGDNATLERRDAARKQIDQMWIAVRDQMLLEFDREVPTYHHAGYAPKHQLPATSPAEPPPNEVLQLTEPRGVPAAGTAPTPRFRS